MIQFCKIRDVKTPNKGTKDSAGFDFFIPTDTPDFSLRPQESILIPSGIKVVIPSGYVGIFLNKSGIGIQGVIVGAQVIDADYRGEIHLNVHNVSQYKVSFKSGQKLVQLVIMPIAWNSFYELTPEQYENHINTERGTGGFGSTGVI